MAIRFALATAFTLLFSCVGFAEDGKSLFDGKTLTGWDGDLKFWSVQDGAITGKTTPENPTKGNTFLIWKGGEVEAFDITL